MRCGKHALNNALAFAGEDRITDAEMEQACEVVVSESLYPDDNAIVSDPQTRGDVDISAGSYQPYVCFRLHYTFHKSEKLLVAKHFLF